jgi:hypothetical protein
MEQLLLLNLNEITAAGFYSLCHQLHPDGVLLELLPEPALDPGATSHPSHQGTFVLLTAPYYTNNSR